MVAKLERTVGPGRRVVAQLAALDGASVEVGVIDTTERYIDENGKPGLPIATILAFHEFGLGVPQRSVIRATLASRRAELAQRATVAAAQVVGGRSVERAVEEVGRWLSRAFVRRIEEGLTPPLARSTLEKGHRISHLPLLKSGQIRQFVRAIRFRVRSG